MNGDKPRCPECGEIAEFEKCGECNGECVSDLTKPCLACFGYGGRYYCEFCLELKKKSGANNTEIRNEK